MVVISPPRVEIKTKFLGPDPKRHIQEVRILNRVITWNDWGHGYEADQRHAELVVRDLGFEAAKAVSTPGSKDDVNRALEANGYDFTLKDELTSAKIAQEATVSSIAEGVELQDAEATRFRGLCARLNYLAQDRPDIRYACKEASCRMARPFEGDWIRLKRIGRYLKAFLESCSDS